MLKRFGLLSAAGGLAGALVYTMLDADALTRVLGGLLVLTSAAQFSGLATRWHPKGATVALLGLGSGLQFRLLVAAAVGLLGLWLLTR